MDNLGEGEGEMGDWGQAFLSANSAGTGAYAVVSHNPQDRRTVMEKNDDYFLGVPERGAGYGPPALWPRGCNRPHADRPERGSTYPRSGFRPEVLGSLAGTGAQLLPGNRRWRVLTSS